MAKKSMKEVSNLSRDEVLAKIKGVEESLFRNRIRMRTGQLENTASVWKERKELARLKGRVTALGAQPTPPARKV